MFCSVHACFNGTLVMSPSFVSFPPWAAQTMYACSDRTHGDARYDTRFLRSVGEGDADTVFRVRHKNRQYLLLMVSSTTQSMIPPL